MPLNYNKKEKGHAGQDSMWTSYSDLFLGLSVVFLLLYVTASLRQGTDGIRQHMEYQQLIKENQDLKKQLEVYSTLKQEYLQKEASNDEQQGYQELMDKLDLLQDQAKDEKIKLQVQANEHDKKEKALNKYQQMIRNIMNANLIAKSRIHKRDGMIDDQAGTITEQTHEITGLEKTVAEKKAAIAQGEAKIDGLEKNLDTRLKQLRNSFKNNQITKKKYEEQQKKIKLQAENQISDLRNKNAHSENELQKISSELVNTKGVLSQVKNDNEKLQTNLQRSAAEHAAQVAKMRGDFASQAASEKAAFEAALENEKLTGDQKAAREAQFREEAERKAKGLGDQIASIDAKYKAQLGAKDAQYNAALGAKDAQFNAALGAKEAQLASKDAQFKAQSAELAKAQENLNARKKLAAQIAGNFRKNGIKADVDGRTGDVVLAFGNQYFDSDSSKLKSGMTKILEQAVPVYSASLFENPKIADKISNVEIVGFASPTFQGKYIDPRSLNADDRAAVNYNLDLSYNRARSIFNHIFDQSKMQFKYQKKLLPLVKVTGRSFFDQADRGVASESPDSFCRKNDCAKLQRVIIKFNLKD